MEKFMKLWKTVAVFILSACYIPLALAAGESPVGKWTTIDEKTGAKRSVVDLKVGANGTLTGNIVSVYPQPGDTGICSKCPGAFKDKKIQGIQFIWGLKDQGKGEWGGGSILDPKSGKVYKLKLKVEGNKLRVRGYVGMSMLGRTQTWVR
jgi:uncharacterized protein (DUF2147 family)